MIIPPIPIPKDLYYNPSLQIPITLKLPTEQMDPSRRACRNA